MYTFRPISTDPKIASVQLRAAIGDIYSILNKINVNNTDLARSVSSGSLIQSETSNQTSETSPRSIYKTISLSIFKSDEEVAISDGISLIPIPTELNGYWLIECLAVVHQKGVGGTTDIQLRRRRSGTEIYMLSSATQMGDVFYANNGTPSQSNNDVRTGDAVYVDVTNAHIIAALGLSVALKFTKG